jgi:hypothetical protein
MLLYSIKKIIIIKLFVIICGHGFEGRDVRLETLTGGWRSHAIGFTNCYAIVLILIVY